ncbi:O-linked N-acetylglucosamine transferase, SPINDLY family protein [Pseudanabaena sp. UWO310]|nr:O-linked N-acetylglucosamine transferase, SPINDLY family protein [Pseudanabaena sp. UWO310]
MEKNKIMNRVEDRAYELFLNSQYPEALTLYEEAIELESEVRSLYWYLGLCLLFQGQLEEAQLTWWITLEESESIKNEFVEFICKTANKFGLDLNKCDMAISILEAAIGLDLDRIHNIYFLIALARFYALATRHLECMEIAKQYRELVQDLPNQIFANHLTLHSLLSLGNQWEEVFALSEEQSDLLMNLVKVQNDNLTATDINNLFASTFFLPYIQDDPIKNRSLQNSVSKFFQSKLQHQQLSEKQNNEIVTTKRPLRIGYLSYCLHKHSVGWLSRWIFKYHDHEKFIIYAYFLFDSPDKADSVREFIISHCDRTYSLGHDPNEIAKQIAEDKIDILVDLDSITLDLSCQIMALKPAPVQVTWLGLDASGLPAIDYFIADPYVLPANAQEYYSEKIWRLPNTYIAVDCFEVLFPTLHRSQLNIPNDAIVYLSSQTGYKRHPDNIRLQMQIIKSVPNSFLLIKGLSDREGIRSLFIEIAESEGIISNRLKFLPMVDSEAEHRANLSIADVVLDTYPYNGATTTMETLWMCIPIVTRVGQQFAARNSYTMMINAGITEGISWSDQEYVDWGIRLGTDENLRKQIFWKLKESRKTCPLWNAEQFARDMEHAYKKMWELLLNQLI